MIFISFYLKCSLSSDMLAKEHELPTSKGKGMPMPKNALAFLSSSYGDPSQLRKFKALSAYIVTSVVPR